MAALEIVTTSMKLIGALAHGEDAEPEEAQDVLSRLNTMLNTWAAEKLTTYVINRSPYTLTSGTATYTLGPTGDFAQQRPQWVERMGIIHPGNLDNPVELQLEVITTQRFAEIPVKGTQGNLPAIVYVDGDFPDRNLTFWPIPDIPLLQAVIYWAQSLASFGLLTTDISVPPAYDEAIIYNLAVRLMPEFGKQSDPAIIVRALELFSILKSSQMATHAEELRCDLGLTSIGSRETFNWRSAT